MYLAECRRDCGWGPGADSGCAKIGCLCLCPLPVLKITSASRSSSFEAVHTVSEDLNPASPLIPLTLLTLAVVWASLLSSFFLSPVASQLASSSLTLSLVALGSLSPPSLLTKEL